MAEKKLSLPQMQFAGVPQAAAPIRQDVYSDASIVPRYTGSVPITGTQGNKNSMDLREPVSLTTNR